MSFDQIVGIIGITYWLFLFLGLRWIWQGSPFGSTARVIEGLHKYMDRITSRDKRHILKLVYRRHRILNFIYRDNWNLRPADVHEMVIAQVFNSRNINDCAYFCTFCCRMWYNISYISGLHRKGSMDMEMAGRKEALAVES